ncbi:MAG: hypothetical protein AB1758_10995 [Candidatus Eremiobacterota bacterium]
MSRMRVALLLLLLVAAGAVAQPARFRTQAAPKDFLGTWSGKWDGTWQIHLTVSQERSTRQLYVVYQWEEGVDEPLNRMAGPAEIRNGRLHFREMIEVALWKNKPGQATAFGHFDQPRTALLRRR